MKCKHCGKEIPEDSVYCEFCGAKQKHPTRWWVVMLIVLGVALSSLGIVFLFGVFHNNVPEMYADETDTEAAEDTVGSIQNCYDVYGSGTRRKENNENFCASGTNENTVYSTQNAAMGYTDLGLPSGTLWKDENEEGFYTYDEAVSKFGDKLPTKEQLEELKYRCQWTWTGDGCMVAGPKGNSIVLPAAGSRGCYGSVYGWGSYGYYWSSTPNGSGSAWYLYFHSGGVGMDNGDRCYGGSVRLVQD